MIKNCVSCGSPFTADKSFKTRCYECWKRFARGAGRSEYAGRHVRNDGDLAMARLSTLEIEYANLKETLRNRDLLLNDIFAHVPALIQLVHPDKHGGKEAAKRETQYLLYLRKLKKYCDGM